MTSLIIFIVVILWLLVGTLGHLMILASDPIYLYPDNCIKYKHLITGLVCGILGPLYFLVALVICFPTWLDASEVLDRPLFKNRHDK